MVASQNCWPAKHGNGRNIETSKGKVKRTIASEVKRTVLKDSPSENARVFTKIWNSSFRASVSPPARCAVRHL